MGITIRDYAATRRERGLPGGSRYGVQKALRDGRITKEEDGTIDPERADREWDANTNEAKRRPPAGGRSAEDRAEGKPATYSEARAIREALNARIARLEYEERIGKLVSRAEVEAEAFRVGRLLRDRLFVIPGRVSAQIAAETNPKRIAALLDREFRTVLDETLGEL